MTEMKRSTDTTAGHRGRGPKHEDLLPTPPEANEQDEKRLQQVRRNVRIRREYPALREEHGWQKARRLLADRYSCSTSTVQKVLEGRR